MNYTAGNQSDIKLCIDQAVKSMQNNTQNQALEILLITGNQ